MRMGHYWKEENIDVHTLERINKILSGEYDENIKNRVREKLSIWKIYLLSGDFLCGLQVILFMTVIRK